MKKFLLVVITGCLIYFIGGFIAVKCGWLDSTSYNSWTAFVGGVATICGLIAFALPKLTPSDIKGVGSKSLQEFAQLADELASKESEIHSKATELLKLDKQKKIEFLVRKASLSVFLQDRIARNENRIIDLLHQKHNEEIVTLLNEVTESTNKLNVLNEEIQSNEHVDLLNEIINKSRNKEEINMSTVAEIMPFPFVGLFKILAKKTKL
ncbi:hypothetical protein [Bacillus toyonensis]|uniref:Uncharacterized protein n=1 Tax=Bacillus toyonensis TaxID=155322 RepID=A0A2B5XJ90_9BACI|nr:hypothetical protein [Bacillus toyonensis]PGA96360.1 hypothetical protein COL93_23935 [Bacillus toyonensis]PHD73207.1 hypothetical protein COF40_04185 [Bacillus toyonensis]